MAMMTRPVVTKFEDGGKYWENTFEKFFLKAYVPKTEIDGQINNYGFRAPLLLILEEKRMSREEAVAFAKKSGLDRVAAASDSAVLFIYPTEGNWETVGEELYASVIKEVKMHFDYADGICEVNDFFSRTFKGWFIRGAIFRADVYGFGKSADYIAKNLLKKVEGEYLWGPGEITPAMCSMEHLSVVPEVQRTDIAILSVGNNDEINSAFKACENLLVKEEADYCSDFYGFVRKFKMWCGNMEFEPDFPSLNMTEEAGSTVVNTSPDNRSKFAGTKTHPVGYFAYYNNDLFNDGPVPLLLGFHGGGDSSMFLTFVSGWWEIAHRYNFLYVSTENHQYVTATEAKQLIDHLKEKYNIDEHRIYCTGFSMGSGKTWDMFQEYPEILAGIAPASALFPVKDNPFGKSRKDGINENVKVPIFYSGGELSPLPELPCQAESALERVQYAASVNGCKKKFDLKFEDRENWENKFYGLPGDCMKVIHDDSRDANLTINYYESEDGVVRTAFASIDNQMHECRHHTNEKAWKFISRFRRE